MDAFLDCRCDQYVPGRDDEQLKTAGRLEERTTLNLPGWPDGLPYTVVVCKGCGAEFPNMLPAKHALKRGSLNPPALRTRG